MFAGSIAFQKSTVLADVHTRTTRTQARTMRVRVGAEAPLSSTAVTPPVAPPAPTTLPLAVTIVPTEKWYVHDAKVLAFGVAIPILVGGLFGTFGLYFGVAIAANVIGQDLYETTIRPRAQGVVA